jgi:CSLREA domain-containing protein
MSSDTGWFRRRVRGGVAGSGRGAGCGRGRRHAGGRHRLRPAVSLLEDRRLLSTFTVNTTKDENDANKVPGDLSLREAIIEANANPGTDTIIVPAGTYDLTIPGAGETAGQTGDLDITDSVMIEGAGAASTIINGDGLDRVFYVFGSSTTVPVVSISGVTVEGGLSPNSSYFGPDNGGGIDVSDASLTVDQSVIQDNSTGSDGTYGGYGGGIEVSQGTLTVTNSTITGNSTGGGTEVGGFGGGIEGFISTITIENCTISDNTTGGGSTNGGSNVSAGRGGGIECEGATQSPSYLNISNSTITGNVSGNSTSEGEGGGIYNYVGSILSLDGSTVSNNTASLVGGGVMNDNGTTDHITDCTIANNIAQGAGSGFYGGGGILNTSGTINLISGTTVSGNQAISASVPTYGGGGIYNDGQIGTIVNSTIANNTINEDGGGILNDGSINEILNTTIAGNTADVGGGVYEPAFNDFTAVIGALTNTILAGNTAYVNSTGDDLGIQGQITSATYDLVQDPTGNTLANGTNGNIVGLAAQLGVLANNGGPTETMALLYGSPAIDAGTNVGAPTTDQRGLPRPVNGITDIGAFEVQGAPYHPPIASNQSISAHENAARNGQVSATDPANNLLAYSVVAFPTYGSLTLQSGGMFTYTPFPNYAGPDSFTFRAFDGVAYSNVATVSITVDTADQPPVANNDSYTTSENTALTVSGAVPSPGALLRYQFDEAGSGTTPALDSGTYPAANGTFVGAATRTASTPQGASAGALDLTGGQGYVSGGDVNKIEGLSAMTLTAWINLQAAPADQSVLMSDNPYYATAPAGDGGWELRLTKPFNNSNPLSASNFSLEFEVYEDLGSYSNSQAVLSSALNASSQWIFVAVTFDANNVLNYYAGNATSPVANAGTATYSYSLGTNSAPFEIGATAFDQNTNHTPPAWMDDVRVYGSALAAGQLDQVRKEDLLLPGILANDTDPEGDPLTAAVVVGPAHGSLSLNADGTFSYTPAQNFYGTDTFTYQANDGQLNSNVATVTITVTRAIQPPVANNDSYSTNENATLMIPAPGVLGNDTDPNNDPLTAVLISKPAHGSLVLNSNGSFSYTPAANFYGTDTFTYQATDGLATSGTATVTLAVAQASPILIKTDATTEGNWIGTYGTQGYDVIGDTPSYPSYATVAASGQTPYTWAASTTDPRALENPNGTGRIAATWYATTGFTVDVNLTDGQAHDLELYFVDWDNRGRSERVQISSATTGAVLDTETVSSFTGGIYLDWKVSGNLVITITRLAGTNAVLSGLFFDPTSGPAPTITWANPANIVYGTALGATQLDATANVPGTFAYAPAAGTVLKAGNGQKLSVTFTPTDTTDYGTATATAVINVLPATPTITWANPAAITSGTALSSTQLDATSSWTVGGATGSVAGTFTYTPAAGTVLGVGNNQTLSVSFTPTDTTDFTSASATVTINVNAAATTSATFLKQDTTTEGSWIGTYGTQGYDVIGDTPSYPSYATVAASGQTSYAWAASTTDPRALENPNGTGRIAATWYATTGFTVDVNLTDGQAHDLELYFLDWDNSRRSEQVQISSASTGAVLDTETVSSFTAGVYLDWEVSGNVVIKITRLTGTNAVLGGLFFDPTAPSTPTTSAALIKTDTTTQGNWIGAYGTQGYDVIGDAPGYPSYATVTASGQTPYTWAASTTDPRALQNPNGTGRIAATWYATASFTVDVNLTDGQAHDLELYFLDWDNSRRSEQVQISSASTGAVLDTETVSSFTAGVYLDWKVSGNLVIKITRLTGTNAVLGGLFFDPTMSGTAALGQPAVAVTSGDHRSVVGVAPVLGPLLLEAPSTASRAAGVVNPAGNPINGVWLHVAAKDYRPHGDILLAAARRASRRPNTPAQQSRLGNQDDWLR